MHTFKACLQALALVSLLASCVRAAPKLKFKEDGTLSITIITDTHFAESAEKDKMAVELINTVLDNEPETDFVMFGGDQVTGLNWITIQTPNWYAGHWSQLVAPVLKRSLPFAGTLGNHDSEADLSRHEIMQLMQQTSNLSLARPGPTNITGAANYWIDVYDSAGANVVARIWSLDSMDRSCENVGEGWGCVASDTVAWFKATAATLSKVPSIAFIHIPVTEFMAMWNTVEGVKGKKGEGVACGLANTGTFQALKDAGVQAIYSGHDHDNDFIGEWEDVRLAYGRQSGFGRYGPNTTWFYRGSRIIKLKLGQNFNSSETWVRNMKGERENQTVIPIPQRWGNTQSVCAAMEDKDVLGKIDCVNGTHWWDSVDFNCNSQGTYDWYPDVFGEYMMLMILGLNLTNGNLFLPVPPYLSPIYPYFKSLPLKPIPAQYSQQWLPYLAPGNDQPTALNLAEVNGATSLAGTELTYELIEAERDVLVTIPQIDGKIAQYRVLPYPAPLPRVQVTGYLIYPNHLSAQDTPLPDIWASVNFTALGATNPYFFT